MNKIKIIDNWYLQVGKPSRKCVCFPETNCKPSDHIKNDYTFDGELYNIRCGKCGKCEFRIYEEDLK